MTDGAAPNPPSSAPPHSSTATTVATSPVRPKPETSSPEPIGPVGYLAIVLAWMIPGLGHFLVGQKARGIIFAIAIHGLFFAGLFLGGIRALNPPEQPIWTYTQFLAGWPMLVTNKIAAAKESEIQRLQQDYNSNRPGEHERPKRIDYGKEQLTKKGLLSYSPKIQDVGSVYCGIAGMLNLLIMFDVLLRITGTLRDNNPEKTRPITKLLQSPTDATAQTTRSGGAA